MRAEVSEGDIRNALADTGRAFLSTFPSLREIQLKSIPPIAEGHDVLVCSATASGKTEAVFAPLIWRLRRSGERTKNKRIRLLAVAPTRALVTDLLHRLEIPCGKIDWKVDAQTSDHSGAARTPDLLITTPESLDSMLVRRGSADDHPLCYIEGIFIDEAHLFDCSARGDQLLFLLERLRRLRKWARIKGLIESETIQICGASATVSAPDTVAKMILGERATVVTVQGGRELHVMTESGEWLKVLPETRPENLLNAFMVGTDNAGVANRIVSIFKSKEARKILMFCQSRSKVDSLSQYLRDRLKMELDVWVGAHHGSLSKELRSRSEKEFSTTRSLAILVATSTLEVGIDIGDVDAVALLGPPSDVSSLMQRVGRGGRRGDVTRVIPFPENHEHVAVLAGMLVSAAGGQILDTGRSCCWGVFIQQIASYIKQNRGAGRSRSSLIELAQGAFKNPESSSRASVILDDMLGNGQLGVNRNRYFLAGDLVERIDEQPTALHSNIRSSPMLLAVRDQTTGEIVGHVSEGPSEGMTNVGGRARKILAHTENEIVVAHDASMPRNSVMTGVRYPTVPFLILRGYTAEVAHGLGLAADQAPMIKIDNEVVWFHFGGQVVEKLFRSVAPSVFRRIAIPGIALAISEGTPLLENHFPNEEAVISELGKVVLSARSRYSRSPFDDFFSDRLFAALGIAALNPSLIFQFISSRRIAQARKDSSLYERLLWLLSG